MANAVDVIGDKLVRGSSRHLSDAHLSYVKPNQEECARKYRALAAVPLDSPTTDVEGEQTKKPHINNDISKDLWPTQYVPCTGLTIPVQQQMQPTQHQQVHQQQYQPQHFLQQQLQQLQYQQQQLQVHQPMVQNFQQHQLQAHQPIAQNLHQQHFINMNIQPANSFSQPQFHSNNQVNNDSCIIMQLRQEINELKQLIQLR